LVVRRQLRALHAAQWLSCGHAQCVYFFVLATDQRPAKSKAKFGDAVLIAER
jgi:hypothetical protein